MAWICIDAGISIIKAVASWLALLHLDRGRDQRGPPQCAQIRSAHIGAAFSASYEKKGALYLCIDN
jgi:hypothetical protein